MLKSCPQTPRTLEYMYNVVFLTVTTNLIWSVSKRITNKKITRRLEQNNIMGNTDH